MKRKNHFSLQIHLEIPKKYGNVQNKKILRNNNVVIKNEILINFIII
jgi:hypothetical protein